MQTPVRVRRRRGGRHARPGRLGRWWRDLDLDLGRLCDSVERLEAVQEAMGDEIDRLRERVDGGEPPPGSSRPPLRLVGGSALERPARCEPDAGDAQTARRIS
jgi:hypothetical protein